MHRRNPAFSNPPHEGAAGDADDLAGFAAADQGIVSHEQTFSHCGMISQVSCRRILARSPYAWEGLLMSEELRTADGRLIKWNRGDRMRKALDVAEISVQDMADYLDVDRSTVSTWLNNRIDPSYTSLRLWSLRTGAPLRWLHHGDTEPCDLEM